MLASVMHLDAARAQVRLQQFGRDRIELAFHQRRHDVQHGGVHAVAGQAVGRLQAEQAAADDHGMGAGLAGRHHRLDVGDVAEADHAGQLVARAAG